MASRLRSDLHPLMQTKATAFVEEARRRGVEVLIYCTYRSNAEQDELYSMGRTTKSNVGVSLFRPLGKVVTNARGGQSAHNFTVNDKPASKAWDCVPLRGGVPMWDAKHPDWIILGDVAKFLGLDWYGAPKASFYELCHFQMVK